MMKSWLNFGVLDLIFKVTAELELPDLSQKVLVCRISHEIFMHITLGHDGELIMFW